MIRINLLPHRELKKAAHRERYQKMLAATLLATLGLAYLTYNHYENALATQQQRNQHLQQAIAKIDSQLSNIENLRKERATMLARKQLVEQLQHSRSEAIRIFDHLIKVLPEGVFIRDFRQSGSSISITGISLSSARVSALMRNLSQSEVFSDPVLIEVKATAVDKINANDFSLNLTLRPAATTTPNQGKSP